MRRKRLREWSFGFIITKAKAIAHGAKEIVGVDLLELGPCLAGMGDTATLAIKSATADDITAAQRLTVRRHELAPYEQQLAAASRRFLLARAEQQLAAHRSILETISTSAVRYQPDHGRHP